jgi:tetratricopeptide (TPR) repeat protein
MADLKATVQQAESLRQMGQLLDARAVCEDVLRYAPDCGEVLSLLALIAIQQGDFEFSLATYDRVIAAEPDLADAHSNRGAALAGMNRWNEALESFERAIEIFPDHAGAHFSRSILWLLQGDFRRGWKEYEWRWNTAYGRSLVQRLNISQPRWLGKADIAGKIILLYSETGLGDTLQFCRFARMVRDLGATVLLQVQEPLVELLTALEGVTQVIAETDPRPPFDVHCPLMSLPLALDLTLQTISANKYLSAAPHRVAHWRAQTAVFAKIRVGLVWRGDPNNPDDYKRSLRLAQLLPHLPAGIRYFSLQKEIDEAERGLLAGSAHEFETLNELNFAATAALCECLDLVISVDTSVAHLSAALGRRTWVLVPHNPDCRWLLDRTDSPWYSCVRLYRQASSGDWDGVLRRVAADLSEELAAAAPIASGDSQGPKLSVAARPTRLVP